MAKGGLFKRGDIWWIDYRVGGRRIRESAETTKRVEAEALRARRKLDLFEGKNFPDRKSGELDMAGLLELWRKGRSSKASWRQDEQRLGAIVEHFGPDRSINTLLPADIDQLRSALAEGREAATVNRYLAVLRSALNYAAVNRYAHRDPMAGVKLAKEQGRDRICAPEEFASLVECAQGDLRLVIILGHETGMRLGEILAIEWRDVDIKGRMVKVRASKNGEARPVPLSKVAAAEIDARVRPIAGGRIFHNTSDRMSSMFSDLVGQLRGVELQHDKLSNRFDDLTFHDFRHTAATRWRRAGIDIITIAKFLGHKTLAMVKRYQTIVDDDLSAAMAKVEKL